MELTMRDVDSSIIQDRPFAYFIQQTVVDSNGEYIVCVAVEGVKGFWETDWHWGTDLDIAESCATDKNAKLDLTEKDAARIVCSTMF